MISFPTKMRNKQCRFYALKKRRSIAWAAQDWALRQEESSLFADIVLDHLSCPRDYS